MNKFWLAYDPNYGYIRGGIKVTDDINGWTTLDTAIASAKKHSSKHRNDVFILEATKLVSFPFPTDMLVTDLVIANDNEPTSATEDTSVELAA